MLIGIWSNYGKKNSEHVQRHIIKHVKTKSEKVVHKPETKPKQVQQPKQPQPDDINFVYTGEEITEDEMNKIKQENKTWFSDMNIRIGNRISDMKSQYMGKEESEHGNE